MHTALVFTNYDEAALVRGRLARLGINAEVEDISIRNHMYVLKLTLNKTLAELIGVDVGVIA